MRAATQTQLVEVRRDDVVHTDLVSQPLGSNRHEVTLLAERAAAASAQIDTQKETQAALRESAANAVVHSTTQRAVKARLSLARVA